MSKPIVRLAVDADLPAIHGIHNHYIVNTTVTYVETPLTMAQRVAWFAKHDGRHPLTVAEVDGVVLGWAAILPFRAYSAYRFTCENSVYVHPDQHRRGIGAALLADTVDRARAGGFHTIMAVIDSAQTPSIALHARYSFEQTAHLKEVGFKFERWLDAIIMQRMI